MGTGHIHEDDLGLRIRFDISSASTFGEICEDRLDIERPKPQEFGFQERTSA